MIVKAFKYRSGQKGAQRLNHHLWKEDGQHVELSETRNLHVPDSAAGLRVMQCLKGGTRAEIAFWHIIISPTTTLDATDRSRVVDMVIGELRAEAHPLMIWSHADKPRARPGGGATHLHLVLGHISPTLRALDMRNHVQRLQKVMAIATYEIEGTIARSSFHRGIAARLVREGRADVAAWLTDMAASAPRSRPPRMTDAMRRAAAAAGFKLPAFQAELERLWVTGASERRFIAFLSSAGITVRKGDRSPHALLLYREDQLVGVMHHILKRGSVPVYREAVLRFPGLCDGPWSSIDTPTAPSREVYALRLEITDGLEAPLRRIRRKVLDLTYTQATSSGRAFATEPDRLAGRLDKLSRAAAILETSIDLLWTDERWVVRPVEALLDHAKRLLGGGTPVTSAQPDNRDDAEASPNIEVAAVAQVEDETLMGPLSGP
ncbi:hypothetical protein IVB45_25635 [Bradyrhizobium sp. 4]|jgi:hypothetical protein|uniref:hypothetical protein n=1 Tax=unclassified Bradyrhizobium TaxID=2631580 RepID=UPI001FF884A5|nr:MULTISPECIES: hypothetical protein [unclassified Bradyrhizobium]MCK1396933.1 hypothetical protein [Bradyrhizobium sp. 39]MCK1747867.1 hypothetical protein [Bradyrhizobium sp. 135]UPJ33312.1 hypothetical protein IVB45_25635 [Bradyrhizobium sp. 4]